MRVECIANNGGALLPVTRTIGGSDETQFHIEIGKIYTVYGIATFRKALYYLSLSEVDLPTWHPAELFKVVDHRLPNNWYFESGQYLDSIMAILGYKELALSYSHYEALAELEPSAVELFLKRKAEIDVLYTDC